MHALLSAKDVLSATAGKRDTEIIADTGVHDITVCAVACIREVGVSTTIVPHTEVVPHFMCNDDG